MSSAQDLAADKTVSSTGDPHAVGLPLLRTAMPIPVQLEPLSTTLDRSRGQIWHRATMLLAGSMCPACLMELEKHLRELPGIAYAKVARQASVTELQDTQLLDESAERNAGPSSSATDEKPRAAAATIIFDNGAIKFDRLVPWIKNEKYRAFDIQDVELSDK